MDSYFQEIEQKLQGATCGCGGTIAVKDSVMLCSKCGYGASVTLSLGNDPVAAKLHDILENRSNSPEFKAGIAAARKSYRSPWGWPRKPEAPEAVSE